MKQEDEAYQHTLSIRIAGSQGGEDQIEIRRVRRAVSGRPNEGAKSGAIQQVERKVGRGGVSWDAKAPADSAAYSVSVAS
jgi:hypothetical protein